jgi:hypothetical protein
MGLPQKKKKKKKNLIVEFFVIFHCKKSWKLVRKLDIHDTWVLKKQVVRDRYMIYGSLLVPSI